MNPNAEPERTTPFPGAHGPRRPEQYKFTPDELRVLRECNKESFYTRCLPFSTVFGGLTYYGIKTGMFKGNPRFGAVPKVATAVIVGYFLGKLSYQKKCAEKFMALPDSKVGRLLKARRLGVPDVEEEKQISTFSISPFSGITDSYSDIPDSNRNSFDYGSTPTPDGLDDSFRPSLDNPIVLHEEEMPPEQKNVTTYEELRKKNREEYEQKRLQTYRQVPPRTAPSQPSPVAKDTEFIDEYKPTAAGKNKYGDVWG
ncbi:hypothetical protein ABEB36_000691 [Hypothenemus hampei]|uniref:OCIA domain-containing protein n=1 Tax=Hypothenemus hampei TaxID=57062 RepID=A0ABD1FCW5_HYPHA